MAKKQKSFAEKASSSPKGKDLVHVKFVKSVPSERDGFWRFNESMISMEKGETLDATLKKMDDEANLADIEMPSLDIAVEDVPQDVNNEEIVESAVEPPLIHFLDLLLCFLYPLRLKEKRAAQMQMPKLRLS